MKAIEIKITIPFEEYSGWWGYDKQPIDKTINELVLDIEKALQTHCDLTKFEIDGKETET
jgi:hypothetical protein